MSVGPSYPSPTLQKQYSREKIESNFCRNGNRQRKASGSRQAEAEDPCQCVHLASFCYMASWEVVSAYSTITHCLSKLLTMIRQAELVYSPSIHKKLVSICTIHDVRRMAIWLWLYIPSPHEDREGICKFYYRIQENVYTIYSSDGIVSIYYITR